MHWVLSGFHYRDTFFGSWPAMLAVVVGLFIASFAARCDRPAVAGVLAGVAVLLNASVLPGIAIVSAVLILSSGATRSQIIRWVVTAGASALVVCAWWLVPFLAGWSRLVRYHVPLSEAWTAGGLNGSWPYWRPWEWAPYGPRNMAAVLLSVWVWRRVWLSW